MNATALQNDWAKHLNFFAEQNAGRQTRLGVFAPDRGSLTDYWLENGLPLRSVGIDHRGETNSIEIRVGSLTHQVKDVATFSFRFSISGDEDGLDITDRNGKTTILRFEPRG